MYSIYLDPGIVAAQVSTWEKVKRLGLQHDAHHMFVVKNDTGEQWNVSIRNGRMVKMKA